MTTFFGEGGEREGGQRVDDVDGNAVYGCYGCELL